MKQRKGTKLTKISYAKLFHVYGVHQLFLHFPHIILLHTYFWQDAIELNINNKHFHEKYGSVHTELQAHVYI